MPPSTIIPTLRYADAVRMTAWLCDTFGFARHLVVEDGAGGIAHAQLTLGSGMIMLGSERDDELGRVQAGPKRLGGTTQSAYVVLDRDEQVDALCTRARTAGAEIIIEPFEPDYGGRSFSCRDPEGHLWHFGSYDPWAGSEAQ